MKSPDDPIVLVPAGRARPHDNYVVVKQRQDSMVATLRDGVVAWGATVEASLENLAAELERIAALCKQRARGHK